MRRNKKKNKIKHIRSLKNRYLIRTKTDKWLEERSRSKDMTLMICKKCGYEGNVSQKNCPYPNCGGKLVKSDRIVFEVQIPKFPKLDTSMFKKRRR